MGNPRNRTLDPKRFEASYAAENRQLVGATTSGDRRAEDTCTRRKRLRFALGPDCSLESESDAKANLSDGLEPAEAPKTLEYAFFKKLRQGTGKRDFPAHKENNITGECKSRDDSDNAGVGSIISQSFQNLKFSFHAQDDRRAESSSLLSPIAGPSKATGNSPEQLDFRNPDYSQPIKKAKHVDFKISCSPFRDRVRSAVASYVYGQGNIFSTKREKLLQLVANTYPESKDHNLNWVDLVNSMLIRLFPNGYDRKHVHRARKLRQQDTCSSWSQYFLEDSAGCEQFHWFGHHGSREAGDLMLLDYGCMSCGSTEFAKWSGDYSLPSDRSSDEEHINYKMKKPYHFYDYLRRRSPWKKHVPSCLSCKTSVSQTSIDIVSQHPVDLPSRQNLLLGWEDEKTDDEDQLQIAPYKFDYDLDFNCETLRKNDYHLGANCYSSLSRIQPHFVSGHYGNIDSYFTTMEETDSNVTSNHFLEDRENKNWNIIHSHSSGSYFKDKDGDSELPCMNNHLLDTPNNFARRELIPTDYPRRQIMCIDQPWEVCGKEVACLNYPTHDDHRYTDEPSYEQTTYGIFPLTLDGEDTPGRSLYCSP